MVKSQRLSPASLTDSWPETPSTDFAGENARLFAITLRLAMYGRSIRSVADSAGLDEGTIRKILSGSSWPDLRTISLLEEELKQALWPQYGWRP